MNTRLTFEILLQEIAEGFVNLRNIEDYIDTVHIDSNRSFDFRLLDDDYCAVKYKHWEIIQLSELSAWAKALV